MPKPSPGNYYIVNKVPTADGETLAINYNGENVDLTVTALDNLPTQLWTIKDYNSTSQTINPQETSKLEIAFSGSNCLTVRPAAEYVWAIEGNDGTYTFQDNGLLSFWSLKEGIVRENVYVGSGTGDEKQYWRLISA